MGTQSSQTQTPVLSLLREVHQCGLTILQDEKTKLLYAKKRINFSNKIQLKSFKDSISAKLQISNQFLLSLLQAKENSPQAICSDVAYLQLLYEYGPKTLSQEIQERNSSRQPFAQNQLISILCSIVRAMTFLQEKKILHGNISQCNIIMLDDGGLKLCDNIIHKGMHLQRILAPEQLRQGSIKTIDRSKADVFALGIMLLKCTLLSDFKLKPQSPRSYKKSIKQMIVLSETRVSELWGQLLKIITCECPDSRPNFIALQFTLEKTINSQRPSVIWNKDAKNHFFLPPNQFLSSQDQPFQELHKVITFQSDSPTQFIAPESLNSTESVRVKTQSSFPSFQCTLTQKISEKGVKRNALNQVRFTQNQSTPLQLNELVLKRPDLVPLKSLNIIAKQKVQPYRLAPVSLHPINQQINPLAVPLTVLRPYHIKPLQNNHSLKSFQVKDNSTRITGSPATLHSRPSIQISESLKQSNSLRLSQNHQQKSQQMLRISARTIERYSEKTSLNDHPKKSHVQLIQIPAFGIKQIGQRKSYDSIQETYRHLQKPKTSLPIHDFKPKLEFLGDPAHFKSSFIPPYDSIPKIIPVGFDTKRTFPFPNTQPLRQKGAKTLSTDFSDTRSMLFHQNLQPARLQIDLTDQDEIDQNQKIHESLIVSQSEQTKPMINESLVLQNFQHQSYCGQKKYGKRNGFGTYHYQDGSYYQGMWVDDKAEGQGTLFYSTGKVAYKGQWRKDKLHGYGILFNQGPAYVQTINYHDLDCLAEQWLTYEGQFEEDSRNGFGRIRFSNGDSLECQFQDDLANGRGVFKTRNQRITGIWKQNRLQRLIE